MAVDTKLMTQAEYSRHRECSREAVRKAIESGRITTFGPDKLIDPVLADAQWQRNTRPRAPVVTPSSSGVPAAKNAVDRPVASGTDPGAPAYGGGFGNDGGSYEEARTRRELAEASIAEMKQAEMEGMLIRADAVRAAWAAKISGARDALLQIPSRVAPVLAAETDLVAVTALLEGELRQALSELSQDTRGQAA